MKIHPSIALSVCLGLSAAPLATAQESAESLAKERASAYQAAWEKRDATALGALFAEDADYTTDTGDSVTGREAIVARSKDFLAANPDAKLSLAVDSAKFLTPAVLVEKGYATLTVGDAKETTRYSATHVKSGDQWLIAEVHESALPAADPGSEALANLDWIIGKWKVTKGASEAETEATWTLDGRFITRTTRIPEEGGEPFVSVEVIGFDSTRGQIRSWIFDNEGGFGEGYWSQDGNKWLIGIRATDPTGSQSSADHILTIQDDGNLTLETINRILDGQALPNSDAIAIVRTGDAPQPAAEK